MRVIAFVNPAAGGNQGASVLDLLNVHLGQQNVFDIRADKGPQKGLEERASDPSEEVRCIVAGGDGTFSWVAAVVDQLNYSHVRLIVIPLGSGNDMARALGWGKKFPRLNNIVKYLETVKSAKSHKLDVWRLEAVAKYNPDHVDDHGVAHGARPLMCNYLSLGADAFVELRFNELRWTNPQKYTSRMGNFRAHALVGFKYMCRPSSKKIFVADHIDSLVIDDQPVDIPSNLQAIIFLNIPSYGAGTQPWGTLGRKRPADVDSDVIVDDMYVDDEQFEVIGLKSLNHFGLIKLFGVHGVRIAQGKRMHLTLKSQSTPFQVDGEPWHQRGGHVSMRPGNKVGVIEGPIYNNSSKKNAKFSPLPRLSPNSIADHPPEFPPEHVIETEQT